MKTQGFLEVCIDNPLSLHHAIAGGADRIELCQSLNTGGLTPSLGFIKWALQKTTVPIRVMIRQRGGDFCYTNDDIETMLQDIRALPQHEMLEGIVVGILTQDHQIDCKKMQKIKEACGNLAVTFHRAFDHSQDAYQALKDLQTCGVDTLLTSGQQEQAVDGIDLLADLASHAGVLQIMICGGFAPLPKEVRLLKKHCPTSWFHIAGAKIHNSNETEINMGKDVTSDDLLITDVDVVKAVRRTLDE